MIAWLEANIGTIVISLILLGAVVAIVRSMIREKKNGSSSCGSSCGGCSACGGGCSACSQPIKIRATKEDLDAMK